MLMQGFNLSNVNICLVPLFMIIKLCKLIQDMIYLYIFKALNLSISFKCSQATAQKSNKLSLAFDIAW